MMQLLISEVEQEWLKMKMPDQDNLPGISLMLRWDTSFLPRRIIRGNTRHLFRYAHTSSFLLFKWFFTPLPKKV